MIPWIVVDIPTHPLKNAKWVEVFAHIRRESDGEVRKYITHEILKEGEEYPNVFNWADGNFSCDCNRDMFFHRKLDEDIPCSERLYKVALENPVTGEIYYSEWEDK